MRIVIVGGTGNLGSAVVRALGDQHDLVMIARRDAGGSAALPASVEMRVLDLASDDVSPTLAGADAVVHLAWLFQPTHHPEVTWRNNVEGTARLLSALPTGREITLVAASSIAAYSPAKGRDPVDETWPTHGTSSAAYAREKAYNERLLDAYEATHPAARFVRFRPAFVFQRASASQQRRLFAGPLVPGLAVRPELIPVVPVPKGLTLQTVHSDDVAAAIVSALGRDVRGAYNLAADDTLDGDALASIFDARHVSVPPKLVRTALAAAWHARLVPSPPNLYDALLRLPVMDTTRAREQLDWAPTSSAAEALAEMLAGLRENAGAPTPPLDPHTGGRLRWREFVTRAGERAD
jgi:nucleoside-diphosphate-sugar epimerase